MLMRCNDCGKVFVETITGTCVNCQSKDTTAHKSPTDEEIHVAVREMYKRMNWDYPSGRPEAIIIWMFVAIALLLGALVVMMFVGY